MFRKILIAVVASLSLLSPLALPASTEAREVRRVEVREVHRNQDFRVYVRGCNREAWRFSGEYRCREDAFRAAQHLRERGLEAFVR